MGQLVHNANIFTLETTREEPRWVPPIHLFVPCHTWRRRGRWTTASPVCLSCNNNLSCVHIVVYECPIPALLSFCLFHSFIHSLAFIHKKWMQAFYYAMQQQQQHKQPVVFDFYVKAPPALVGCVTSCAGSRGVARRLSFISLLLMRYTASVMSRMTSDRRTAGHVSELDDIHNLMGLTAACSLWIPNGRISMYLNIEVLFAI